MKKIFILLVFAIVAFSINAQRVVYRDRNTVTLEYPATRRVSPNYQSNYQMSSQSDCLEQPSSGCVGFQFHCDYNFSNVYLPVSADCRGEQSLYKYPCIEFGGALFYNFGKKAKGNFGLLVGYDYGTLQWWTHKDNGVINDNRYWDIRAGVNISKYFGIGMTIGQYLYEGSWKDDLGVYANLNLPCSQHFGLMIDGKWTNYQGFSVGGGIFLKINTKY